MISKKIDKNVRLGLLGILLGLVGVIVSLITPAIDIILRWTQGLASPIERLIALFYLILAMILFVLEVKIYKKAFPGKKVMIRNYMRSHKKILTVIIFLISTIILVWFSWVSSNKFMEMASEDYARDILGVASILTAFGLLVFNRDKSSKLEEWYLSWIQNLKTATTFSFLSAALSLVYLVYHNEQYSRYIFGLSSLCIFLSLSIILLFFLFHENQFINEVEKGEMKLRKK